VSSVRLTETSYIVLGLLEQIGPATPYDLKRVSQLSTVNFWSVPHTQLYTECARLTKEGLLEERREKTGRRRRIYRLTDRGRQALERWRSEPTAELDEVRDIGMLKLFFGGDPVQLAAVQLTAHRRQQEVYEQLHEQLRTQAADVPSGWLLALEAGIGHEREFVRFWSRVSETAEPLGEAGSPREPLGEAGSPWEPLGEAGPPREPLSETDPPR
jgi:PadR family transcriptional regulator, regulatory protein AphA